jgi:glycosyltransferase involved in cell wall biosynthesis
VVHSHGYRTDVVDGGSVRRLGIPTVSTAHGFTDGGWRNRLYEWVQVAALRRFDAVVAVSRPVAARLLSRGLKPERTYIVPNAWSEILAPHPRAVARAVLGVSDERFLVGWVGRMTHEKGLDVLIEALACLRDLPIWASAVGQGPECVAAKARAQSLGLAGRVRWGGLVPQASRFFTAFDVFVLSSRTEGVPIVLFEAMAAGVPIVATRVGGVPDVLTAADAVLLPPDNPAALAEAIRSVYTDPDTARLRASAAQRKLGEKFGLLPWLGAYEAIYRQCGMTAAPRG